MKLIKSFKALRPKKGKENDVIAPPYDVLNSAEAREMAKNKPFSFLHVSKPEIDLDNKMYQFDTTAEIGKNIYLNGSGKYKKYIGYKCTFAIKYYDEEYNFLVQKCKSPSKNN